MRGLDKLWAFKSELRPLSHVSGVAPADAQTPQWWHGIRAPGTQIPGVITAGTFYERKGLIFVWNVRKLERAIAITLHDDRFATIVVEVEDPIGTIAHIETALAARLKNAE